MRSLLYIMGGLYLMGGLLLMAANPTFAQVGCVPNPSLNGRGCTLPTSALNQDFAQIARPPFLVSKADPSDATDSSNQVQNEVATLCSSGGGMLIFPAGLFKVHDITIACSGVTIAGLGLGDVQKIYDGATSSSIDCRTMTAWCFQITPAPTKQFAVGNGVRDLSFIGSSTGSGVILSMNQIYQGRIVNLRIYTPPNGIKVYGSQDVMIDHVQVQGANGVGLESYGDNANSMNWLQLNDINISNVIGSNTVGMYFHDQIATVNLNDAFVEFGGAGVKVRCAPGQTHINTCPSHFRFKNFESEFTTLPADLQDFTWFFCVQCYLVGKANVTNHDFSATFANYSADGYGGGEIYLTDVFMFDAMTSNAYIQMPSVTIEGGELIGGNVSNVAPTTAPVIEIGNGDVFTIANVHFCATSGQNSLVPGTNQQAAVLIDSTARYVNLVSNNYKLCYNPMVINNSGYTVKAVNEEPEYAASLTSTFSGIGSTGLASAGGNQRAGFITFEPAGTGITNAVTFELDFVNSASLNAGNPQLPSPVCNIYPQNGTAGTWTGPFYYIASNASAPLKFIFTAYNGTTPFTSGQDYKLLWRCFGDGG